jgi:hypothetical protein
VALEATEYIYSVWTESVNVLLTVHHNTVYHLIGPTRCTICFQFTTNNSLYMFWALFTHHQKVMHMQQLVNFAYIVSADCYPGSQQNSTKYTNCCTVHSESHCALMETCFSIERIIVSTNWIKQLHTLLVLHFNCCLTTEYSETRAHFNGNLVLTAKSTYHSLSAQRLSERTV